jgi:hypothetical protein
VGGIVFGGLVRDCESERTYVPRPQDTHSKPRAASPGPGLRCSGQSRKVYGRLGVRPTVKLERIRGDGPVGIQVTGGGKSSVQQIVVGYWDGWYRHVDRGSSDIR